MGQVQSSQPDDASCFRACLREKKQNSLKRPAAPYNVNDQYLPPQPPIQNAPQPPQPHLRNTPAYNKNTGPDRAAQTSIQERLEQQINPIKPQHKARSSADRTTRDQQKPPQTEGQEEQGVILGLESKFSSSRKTTIPKHGTITRITNSSEGLPTKSHYQKQGGSSDETNNKSQGASTESTGKSRNILINKIEEIKQKYYERELQIQIYQGQNQYEENLQQNPTTHRPTSPSLVREPRDVGSVREKIVEKLNKRKNKKQKKAQPIQNEGNEEETNKVVKQQLQLYSKDGLNIEREEGLKESGIQTKNNNLQQILNQSARSTKNQDISTDERIQFSGYSQQQTLHQIRQCDEQQQDYKSKMESNRKSSHISKDRPACYKFPSQPSNRIKDILANSKEQSSLSRNVNGKGSKRGSVLGEGASGSMVSGQGARGNKIYVF